MQPVLDRLALGHPDEIEPRAASACGLAQSNVMFKMNDVIAFSALTRRR
jgi:hypothetical protein